VLDKGSSASDGFFEDFFKTCINSTFWRAFYTNREAPPADGADNRPEPDFSQIPAHDFEKLYRLVSIFNIDGTPSPFGSVSNHYTSSPF
jgi:hypothetical protein